MIERRTLLMFIDGQAIELEHQLTACVDDLLTALQQAGLCSTGHDAVGWEYSERWFPSAALLSDCQLREGSSLRLGQRGQSDLDEVVLSAADAFRIVHEDGRLAGHAWPVGRGGTGLSINWDRGLASVATSAAQATLVCRPTVDPESVHISFLPDVVAEVSGVAVAGETEASVGSLIRLSRGVDATLLRVMSCLDHDLGFRGETVPYRVTGRTPPAAPEATPRIRLTSPPDRTIGPYDWGDAFVTDSPMIGMGLLFGATRVIEPGFGNKLLGIAAMALPFTRMAVRSYQHSKRRDEVSSSFNEWKAENDREIGVIKDVAEREAQRLRRGWPENERLVQQALNGGSGLWQRRARDHDFLQLAIGRGLYRTSIEADFAEPLTSYKVAEARAALDAAREVDDVPVVHDLQANHLAMIGDRDEQGHYLMALVPQVVLQHSPNELNVAICLPPSSNLERQFGWLRPTPHLRRSALAGSQHGFAIGSVQGRLLLETLLGGEPDSEAHTVLIVHESAGLPAAMLRRAVQIHSGRLHVVWLGSAASRVPEFVKTRIERSEVDGYSFSDSAEHPPFVLNGCDVGLLASAVEHVARYHDDGSGSVAAGLPRQVGIMASLGISDKRPLDRQVATQWMSSEGRAARQLRPVLGVSAAGSFCPDLVDAGPHLLIGGTTGSGKSELLRSLVLSLAFRYSPREVSVLLIDFKGGAGLKDLQELPHCIGGATNLEAEDVGRLIDFLTAEVNRRQGILRPFQGDYARFRDSGGQLPRLVVVIDEFGGFAGDGGRDGDRRTAAMINIAARGRSLGIHLVLATQQPKRSVNSQISANVNARLCLRTLDEDDSVSVIDSKRAAHIPRSLPGRCYARLSSSELVEFQSARSDLADFDEASILPPAVTRILQLSSGLRVNESEADRPSTLSDATRLISACQQVLYSRRESSAEEDEEQVDLSQFERVEQPVLHRSLSEQEVSSRPEAHGAAPGVVTVGLADEPARLQQLPREVELSRGAVLFEGGPLSGKSSALVSLAQDALGVDPRTIVIALDIGSARPAAVLRWGGTADHIVAGDEPSEARFSVEQLLYHLDDPKGRRESRRLDPPILVCVDRIDLLVHEFRSNHSALLRLLTEGPANGLYVIATRDTRLPIERHLLPLFHYYFSSATGSPQGRFADAAGIQVQVYPPQVESPSRDQARGVYALGRPGSSSMQTVPGGDLQQESGTVLGLDEMDHSWIRVMVGDGFAIAGPSGSGRTSALLSLATRIAVRTGKRSLVLAPIVHEMA